MISVIICSINPLQLKEISKNIENTIGVPYELIAINNNVNPRGITSVYNEGVKKANYEHLCLVHEDVKFNTKEWGKVLIRTFKDEKLGLVGVAGGAHKPKVPSGWGPSGVEDRFVKINMIQHFKHDEKPPMLQYYNLYNEKVAEVACLDGLFLASRKSILTEIPFDEDTFTGFHCYDIDISIAIGQKYKVAVTYEIEVEHFSEGSIGKDWIENTLLVHEKWKDVLPVTIGPISQKEKIHCEKQSYRYLVRIFKQFVPIEKAYRALEMSELKRLHFFTYIKMHVSLFRIYYLKKK